MAPISLDPPFVQPASTNIVTKSIPICSDPLVVPSAKASEGNKRLWFLHGHPHSRRYANPKLVSLAALVRHDGQVYKGRDAFLYPQSAESETQYKSMTWDDFDLVTETIASLYAEQLRNELEEANKLQKQPTIALLGGGRVLEYFCTQLALQKLGVRVLLLAESNAPRALRYLLETCNAVVVITDSKNSAVDTMGIRKLDMIDWLPRNPDLAFAKVDTVKFQGSGDIWDRHSFILHSSGSTGMPKPVVHTNRSMMLIARMYRLFQTFEVQNWFLLFPL
jgi:acyl-CoA synthetase (AMP-forming)/AMP-acid ligase II